MRQRAGFTLIEVIFFLGIFAVIAGFVVPSIVEFVELSEARQMRSSVRKVREAIMIHSAIGDVPSSREGYPLWLADSWFRHGLPRHVWTGRRIDVQIVHGPKEATYPNHKTYEAVDGEIYGHTAWYNAANGSFCVLVPVEDSDEEILRVFNYVNDVDAEVLNQDDFGGTDTTPGDGRGRGRGRGRGHGPGHGRGHGHGQGRGNGYGHGGWP